MNPLRLSIALQFAVEQARETARVRGVLWRFGMPVYEPPGIPAQSTELLLAAGSVVLIHGPSGSGKSTLLRSIARQLTSAAIVADRSRSAAAVVDQVAPRGPLADAVRLLTLCGLGEPRLWVRPARRLSDGERFRAALARAVGEARSRSKLTPILCDEFGSLLHRRLARCIACNVRKLATQTGLSFVLAARDDDLLEDLQPDVRIELRHGVSSNGSAGGATGGDEFGGGGGGVRVTRHQPVARDASILHSACIEPGTIADYHAFAPMHYRVRDGLGFVDRVFVARDGGGGDVLAVVVYAHAPLELAPRNAATAGRFSRNGPRLQRELRILRRLVVHPDVRGCGVGHWLVRQTLPRVGVRFVECLAAMGAANPVFEKAGMTRVGPAGQPRGRRVLLDRLRKLRLDPFAPRFEKRLRSCPRVRRLVQDTIRDWTKATRGPNASRPDARIDPAALAGRFRQLLGEPPLYYLWDREGEFPLPPASPAPAPTSREPEATDERRAAPRGDPARPAAHGGDGEPAVHADRASRRRTRRRSGDPRLPKAAGRRKAADRHRP